MNLFVRSLKKKRFFYPLFLAPIAYLAVPILNSDTELLADPAKYLLEYVGLAATALFVVTLCVTPLRKIFPKSNLVKVLAFHRRAIGLSVFVYALLHFLIYFAYTGTWVEFVKDWDKLFILSGILAFFLLLALAITSNNRSVRALGGKRWKRLHRLAYLIMFLLIYHQAAQEKTGYRETVQYFAPLIILQACRIAIAVKNRTDRGAAQSQAQRDSQQSAPK